MYIPAIQQLANMEYQLYGYGTGLNSNCPSYFNGYMGQSSLNNAYANYYNPAFRGGYTGQDIFTQQNDATAVNNPYKQMYETNPQVDWSNPQFRGLSDDLNTIGDYYVKNAAPSESLLGAAVGGAAFGLMNNMRLIAHPWNSIRWALKPTAEMFTDIGKEGTNLRKLWLNPETNGVVREAYGQMHKLHGATHSRLGLIKARLKGDSLTKANEIIRGMEGALKSGDVNKIAEFSEEARRLTNAKTGYIPKGLKAIKADVPFKWAKEKLKDTFIGDLFGIGKPKPTVAEAATKSVTEKAAASTLGGALKHSCGVLNGLMFAIFEFASDLLGGKIQSAFAKDNATGYKQLGQTAVKGVGSAVGWAVGEGIGTWAGLWAATKIGTMAGTMIAPGVGTAIGAVAGLIGGSIGCWLTGKLTHKIIGQEAGTLAEVERMKQSAQGQVELLKLTANQAQEDKKVDPRTLQAINNIAQFYGAQG